MRCSVTNEDKRAVYSAKMVALFAERDIPAGDTTARDLARLRRPGFLRMSLI
jgi:hypothetical protein